MLPANHPALIRYRKKQCATLQDIQAWVAEELSRQKEDSQGRTRTDKDHAANRNYTASPGSGPDNDSSASFSSVSVPDRPCSSLSASALAANAALSLLNLACYLLDRQLAAQAKAFESEGGFTERLYRVRNQRRRGGS